MKAVEKIKEALGDSWLPEIYRNKVRTIRTRAYKMSIPEKENETEILHTLLGIELKVGRRRISCPDLSTARYLQIFARIGVTEVAIPYDITKISHIADELESSWQKTLLLIENFADSSSKRSRSKLRNTIASLLREEIRQIGAGPLIPEFRQDTRQRS
ncbi:MAG: hypothetical protein N2Z23_06620 [Pyrinomonadaceae bacterium]|nr:hypothetical protein [Pyrinomonadaceae bacterium]MCX7640096.1 hypothetical protein [Pyrinomonadaceae bacterium]MDW8304268.1 hypothetical protein [Acidobacteriota bacterium]